MLKLECLLVCVSVRISGAAVEFAGLKASVLFVRTVLPRCIVIWYCTIEIQDSAFVRLLRYSFIQNLQ